MKIVKYFVFLILLISVSSCRDTINTSDDGNTGLEPPPEFGPGLSLISPSTGDIWMPGSGHEIIWEVVPNEFKVDILLYRKSEFKFAIAEGIENTGSYYWQIPNSIQESHHYRIHIRYGDNPYQMSFKSEEFFVIK